jgi:hypothetical protein
LVAVITIIAVWLVPVDEQPETPSLPDLPGASQPGDDLPPLAEGDAGEARAGDKARTFVANLRSSGAEADPEIVFVEADRLQNDGLTVDAYLLYRYAARLGHGQAALALGTLADASFQSADSSDTQKDEPEQAYKWYSVAVDAGVKEADARLKALRKRVEQSAADGDEHAQRLMLQWQ